jgi:hypothetical protein
MAGSSVSRWVPSAGRVGPRQGDAPRGRPPGASTETGPDMPGTRRAEMLRARLRRLAEGTDRGRTDDLDTPEGFGEGG